MTSSFREGKAGFAIPRLPSIDKAFLEAFLGLDSWRDSIYLTTLSMRSELIINCNPTEIRIARLENGTIAELFLERAREAGSVGNVYKGRITHVLPGMQAAFVDIGLERTAFLYVTEIAP